MFFHRNSNLCQIFASIEPLVNNVISSGLKQYFTKESTFYFPVPKAVIFIHMAPAFPSATL